MPLILQSDLDDLVDHKAVFDRVHVSETASGKWSACFHVKLLSGRIEEYQLLSQRGQPRTWADLRPLLRFLSNHYGLTSGTFSTKSGAGS